MLGVLLLLAVFVPGLGKTVNGSTRWINLVVIQLQASEVAKMCLAFYLAGFLVRFGSEATQTFWGFFRPLIVTGLYGGLLLLEPDLGAFVIMFGMVLCVLFWPVAALCIGSLSCCWVRCWFTWPSSLPNTGPSGSWSCWIPGNTAIPRPIS